MSAHHGNLWTRAFGGTLALRESDPHPALIRVGEGVSWRKSSACYQPDFRELAGLAGKNVTSGCGLVEVGKIR